MVLQATIYQTDVRTLLVHEIMSSHQTISAHVYRSPLCAAKMSGGRRGPANDDTPDQNVCVCVKLMQYIVAVLLASRHVMHIEYYV